MDAALSTAREPETDSARIEGRPRSRARSNTHSDPTPLSKGGFRFWTCTYGSDGRSRAMAVWGLWLDQELVFAADSESVTAGDPRVFTASVVQVDDDGAVKVLDGRAERVYDPALLVRFASECEAKYGFEPDPADPDTPVYAIRSRRPGLEVVGRA
jgi:hypothetical protein